MPDYQISIPQEESQSGFASGFLLGLVVGGAGGYFLTTDKGRKLLKSLLAQAGDKLEDLEGSDAIKNILSKLNELEGEKKEVVNSIKEKVNAVATEVAEATTTKKPPKKHFFSGISSSKK